MTTRQYEVHEEYRSRSRHRVPSPIAATDRGGFDRPAGFEAEYYPGGTPIPVIETEGGVEAAPHASGALQQPCPSGTGTGALQLPPSHSRPRSVPPLSNAIVHNRPQRRPRRRSRSSSRSPSPDWFARERQRLETIKTPAEKAGEVLKDKFSHSTAGLGVGILGAAVGAWVASEASDAHGRYRTSKELEEHHDNPKYRPTSPRDSSSKSKIALAVLGAVVGGLGANAIERRVEDARERDKDRRESWERRWRDGDGDRDHYNQNYHHRRRSEDYDYDSADEARRTTREMEIRSHGRRVRRDDDSEFEEEDYVYEERRPRRRLSESRYRYRS